MLNKLFKAHKDNREDGFTLLELLIVIVIVGILAAIAVPVFNNQETAAKNATVKSDVRNTITPVQTALVSNPNATGFTVLRPGDTAASISILKGSVITVPSGYVAVHLTKTNGNDEVITNPDGTGAGSGSGYLIHGQNSQTGFWSEYLSTTGKFTSSDKAGSVPIVATSRVPSGATSVTAPAAAAVTPITASGAAIDLFNGGILGTNASFDLTGSSGLLMQNGPLNCSTSNSVINGDVTVKSLNFTGYCRVFGNATVAGSAVLGSGSITGNLSAASVSPNPPGSKVGKTYTQTSSPTATAPWSDVTYNPSDWVDAAGAQFQVLNAPTDRSCNLSSGNLGGTASPGKSVIINMMACPGGPSASSNSFISLTSDVVIFAQQFNWAAVTNMNFGSSTTSAHRLWFITPDSSTDAQPTCNRAATAPDTQGNFSVGNAFTASQLGSTSNLVRAMVYTPCAFVAKNGFSWSGQIYAGAYSYLQNNPSFTSDIVGIAGWNLGTGARSK